MEDHLKVTPMEGEERDGYYVQPLLKRLWAVQLDILKEIDTICRRHNIRYFGWFGTLLGAVRHHGYIPWDDDMDLAMVREDYERFRYYAKTELPMGWVVSEEYPTWICILNTNKFQLDQKFLDRFHGCPFITGVDIFCIDHTPPSIEDEELHINMFQAVNSLCLNWNLPEDDAQWNGVSKWSYLAEIEELTSCPIDRQRPVKAQLYFLADRIAAMYWEDGSHEMTRLTRFSKDRHYRIPASCFEKIIEIPFEHTMLPVLEDYDLICRLDFGENYMTPIRTGDHEYLKKQISALKKIYEEEGKLFPECFDMTFE